MPLTMHVVNPSPATDFVPAIMIYRRACATAHQAQARAAEHLATGRNERRLREVDATVETIVLAQAACEGWIHAAYRLAQVDPPQGGWVARGRPRLKRSAARACAISTPARSRASAG